MAKFEWSQNNHLMCKVKLMFLVIVLVLVSSGIKAQRGLCIENKFLKVEVSTLGAEMQSIKSVKTSTEYLWQGDEEHWEGKAPVMFPVNVKFKEAHYTYKGKEYEMPDMGLAKISTFKMTDISKEEVVLQLESNEETLAKYPFPFRLEITYRLNGRKIINEFVVENTGDETMYFALGGHPGFRFPVKGKSERSQNGFVFDKTYKIDRIEIAEGLVQENEIPFLKNENGFAFDDERIPNAGMFLKKMPSRKIGIGTIGGPTYVTVDLKDFPNVNMWTPPGMPFACIEPMLGHHDLQNTTMDIDKKTYLTALPAGKKKAYSFSIIINE